MANKNEAVRKALLVFLLTAETREFLKTNDPKGLEQAEAALKGDPLLEDFLAKEKEEPAEDKERSSFAGRRIKNIRPMTKEEADIEGWSLGRHGPPPVVDLDDGSKLYPSRDPEGNGPGAMFGIVKGQSIRVC